MARMKQPSVAADNVAPLNRNRERDRRRRFLDRLTTPLVIFWYDDLPALSGPLRFAFYFSILAVFIIGSKGSGTNAFKASSCERAVSRFQHYSDLGFPLKRESGFFGMIVSSIDPSQAFNCNLLSLVLRWGMALSAVGLAGRLPRVVTAVCWWTMFGIWMSTWGGQVGHQRYLPGVAMAALSFAEGNLVDRWSFDSILYKIFERRNAAWGQALMTAAQGGRDGTGPPLGSAARKLVLLQATFIMFCAGLHKLASNGYHWLDGATILDSMEEQSGKSPLLQSFILEHHCLFMPIMATASVLGELGAVAVLLSPWWRPFGVASFVAFHIGIMLVMYPNFVLNICTYILIVDWQDILYRLNTLPGLPSCEVSCRRDMKCIIWCFFLRKQRVVSDRKCSYDSSCLSPPLADSRQSQYSCGQVSLRVRIASSVLTLVGFTMFGTGILRIDFFPFSSWALYNFHAEEPGFERHLTAEEAQEAAGRCVRQPPLNPACGNLGGNQHHVPFMKLSEEYYDTVMILWAETTLNTPTGTRMEHCAATEFSLFLNWEPHSCLPQSDIYNRTQLEQLKAYLSFPISEANPDKRKPEELKIMTESHTSGFENGLNWRIIDAVAASIDEGPNCFNHDSWDAEPSPTSPASHLARQLRTHFTAPSYLDNGETVIAFGIFYEFREERTLQNPNVHSCLMGASIAGEELEEVKFEDRRKHRAKSDWTEVYRGIVITSIMGLTLYWRVVIIAWLMIYWRTARRVGTTTRITKMN